MRKPKSSTDASLARLKRDDKLRKLEAKLAAGWEPPPPKAPKPRAADLLEEVTPLGIQLTIFSAIAAADGTVRAQELQQYDAGGTSKPGRGPRKPTKTSVTSTARAETEEEKANKAWLASAFG